LNDVSNDRRIRLFTSRGTVPQLLWYLLFLGGIVLIAFTYFFGHESVAWQSAMTAALAGTLAFSLYLIMAFNGPFDGSTRVNPTPYEVELQHILDRQ
jgi:Na+/proline symporter